MKMTIALLSILLAPLSAWSADYHVDSKLGDDNNPGISAQKPWRTLETVNAKPFQPGDRILLQAGSAWSGQGIPERHRTG